MSEVFIIKVIGIEVMGIVKTYQISYTSDTIKDIYWMDVEGHLDDDHFGRCFLFKSSVADFLKDVTSFKAKLDKRLPEKLKRMLIAESI